MFGACPRRWHLIHLFVAAMLLWENQTEFGQSTHRWLLSLTWENSVQKRVPYIRRDMEISVLANVKYLRKIYSGEPSYLRTTSYCGCIHFLHGPNLKGIFCNFCNPDAVILICIKNDIFLFSQTSYGWQIAKETFDNFGDMWRYLVNDVIQVRKVVASDTCLDCSRWLAERHQCEQPVAGGKGNPGKFQELLPAGFNQPPSCPKGENCKLKIANSLPGAVQWPAWSRPSAPSSLSIQPPLHAGISNRGSHAKSTGRTHAQSNGGTHTCPVGWRHEQPNGCSGPKSRQPDSSKSFSWLSRSSRTRTPGSSYAPWPSLHGPRTPWRHDGSPALTPIRRPSHGPSVAASGRPIRWKRVAEAGNWSRE